ncbi:MAG: tetratricopeptide repeat protein [Lentisphaeria bacterium]|nr:tetratricopeptide repeat protein [Candidatus Neomarinimicrobiota bacterium]MCF7841379.1 tetratricopeptide repeat protein [Lentisphaeria bacterium]
MLRWLKISPALLLAAGLLNSCAYYNTFYNAKSYFAEAQKATENNQTDQVSREEIQLYAKAIDKSKRLLTKFPESKYRDDAQFIIAKSYYFRQDYRLARRYFEDLPKQFPDSPYAAEIPLWLGRCLMKQGDLAMAKHEARRTIEKASNAQLQVESFLLLGQIALSEDSLTVAREYLERVISESRDGEIRAQAQFQIGNLLAATGDYEEALTAFQRVNRYNPNESLKIQTIINQNRMLQKLGRGSTAIELIQQMLEDEKFDDIKGQLQVELGKAYFEEGWTNDAITTFELVMEEYRLRPYAAEAAYWLGELYLNQFHQYNDAVEAYGAVSYHDRKSPFLALSNQRTEQIQRYKDLQFAYHNLARELAGLPPEAKPQPSRNTRATPGRDRTPPRPHGRPTERRDQPANPANKPAGETQPAEPEAETVLPDSSAGLVVSPEDSLKIMERMMQNRYELAEHFVFRFQFYDSTRALLETIEETSLDTALKSQAAYMRYYLASEIQNDPDEAKSAKAHIQAAYPVAYEKYFHEKQQQPAYHLISESRFREAEQAFLNNDRTTAVMLYQQIVADSTASEDSPLRERSLFNLGWVYDHYLLDQEQAVAYYQTFRQEFPQSKWAEIAQERLEILTNKEAEEDTNLDEQGTESQSSIEPGANDTGSRNRDPDKPEQK